MSILGFVAMAIAGVFVGILSGLLGIGGGTVMVPLLRLGAGVTAISATATSLFTIVSTSISGVVTHIRNKTCLPKIGLAAGIGGACTSPVGVKLAEISPGWLIMLVAALVIAYSAVNMFRKAIGAPKKAGAQIPTNEAPNGALNASQEKFVQKTSAEEFPAREITTPMLFKAAAIGLLAGLAAGYVGVGGGFIMVPLFLSVLGIPMKHASGTSLIAIMILAIPGIVTQGMLGNINYLAGIALAVGGIPGAWIGASLVSRIPERTLRFLFGAILVVTAIVLVLNEFGILGN